MKRLIFACLLFVAPALAFAQQPMSPGQRALEVMLNREMTQHQQDLGAAIQLQDQNAALTKQIADLTKKLADATPPPDKSAGTPAPVKTDVKP